jgi:hypothetical protein
VGGRCRGRALRAIFDEIGCLAAKDEGEEIQVDASEGEDVGHFWRGGWQVAKRRGIDDGWF